MKRLLLIVSAFAVLSHTAFAQGSLTPPGAPAPTMRTLLQVEPRTPITNLPFTITSPGSYYMVTNLIASSNTDGIMVDSDDVTIDLGGFVLDGNSALGRRGVYIRVGSENTTIMNGTVTDWGLGGIDGTNSAVAQVVDIRAKDNGLSGIALGSAARVRDCHAIENGFLGIKVGSDSAVEHCTALSNSVHGILLGDGSRAEDCVASRNTQLGIGATDGSSIIDCVAEHNSTDGIQVGAESLVRGNNCRNNGAGFFGAGLHVTGANNRLENNHLLGADRGLWVTGTNNYIAGNTVRGNAENYVISDGNQLNLILSEIPETIDWPAVVELAGTLTGTSGQNGITIDADQVTVDMKGHSLLGVAGSLNGISVVNSTPDHKQILIKNGTLRDWDGHGLDGTFCSNSMALNITAIENGLDGIVVDDEWTVDNCHAIHNGGIGISASDNCIISDCIATFNGSNGIKVVSVTLVRDCVVQRNGGSGIRCQNDNRIINNLADDNDIDGIRITSGDTVVDGNHVTDNEWRGIAATSSGAFIIRNTAAGNSTNYFFAANNRYGPTVDVDSVNGSIEGTANSDHPWANFEF